MAREAPHDVTPHSAEADHPQLHRNIPGVGGLPPQEFLPEEVGARKPNGRRAGTVIVARD
jgi:hypothetical protein